MSCFQSTGILKDGPEEDLKNVKNNANFEAILSCFAAILIMDILLSLKRTLYSIIKYKNIFGAIEYNSSNHGNKTADFSTFSR